MPCTCLDTTLQEFKEKCVDPQMAETPHVEGSVCSGWDNRVLVFSSNNEPKFPISMSITTTYRPVKKDNTPAVRDKKLVNSFLMKFCPLCGVEYAKTVTE